MASSMLLSFYQKDPNILTFLHRSLCTNRNYSSNFSVFELLQTSTTMTKSISFWQAYGKVGSGVFFSPADIINLAAIDPEDPEKQREGPISLRVHFPIEGTQTNLWFISYPMKNHACKIVVCI